VAAVLIPTLIGGGDFDFDNLWPDAEAEGGDPEETGLQLRSGMEQGRPDQASDILALLPGCQLGLGKNAGQMPQGGRRLARCEERPALSPTKAGRPAQERARSCVCLRASVNALVSDPSDPAFRFASAGEPARSLWASPAILHAPFQAAG